MHSIYVACGRDGLVKVGRTKDFKRRRVALRQEFRRFGNEIVRFECFEVFTESAARVAELRLLWKLQGHLEPYYGREWFKGDADMALYAASVAAQEEVFSRPRPVYVPLPPEEVERLRRLRAKEREESARARAEFMQRRKAEVQARREMRELRRKEMAERHAIRFGLIQKPCNQILEA